MKTTMRGKLISMGAALVLAGATLFPTPALAAAIAGTITLEGKVPNLPPIRMDADDACAEKHAQPVPSEMLVLGPGNALGNVLVRVKSGLPAGKIYAPPEDPVVMDQNGCRYVPHVLGVMVGQPLKIRNSDGILHSVHGLPKVNRPFNKGMPPTFRETVETFTKEEGTFLVKCDIHPWMNAYVSVLSHPFFAVTGPDGKFTISGLDAGRYEIEAWHEKLGTQSATVTIGASETQSVSFRFRPTP